jgi:hypothetical protein
MRIVIPKEVIEVVKKFVELYENYIGSTHTIDRALKSIGKDQIEIAAVHINYKNPDYIKLIEYYDGLTSFEQKIIIVLWELGQIHYEATMKDLEMLFNKNYNKKNQFYDMITKSALSKHLRLGLIKLDSIERIN